MKINYEETRANISKVLSGDLSYTDAKISGDIWFFYNSLWDDNQDMTKHQFFRQLMIFLEKQQISEVVIYEE